MLTSECFRLSVNTALIDKPSTPAMKRESSKGWTTFELSREELVASVQMGCAFAPEYAEGHRISDKFISANFLAADCDGTMTITEARDNAFINSHASFMYTTPSHTNEEHRFRVVFRLDSSITDGRDWADATFGLAHKLGTDATIGDAARCFFGSTDAQVWMFGSKGGPVLPDEIVEELIAYGTDLRAARTSGFAVNSTQKFTLDTVVRLASGDEAVVSTIPIGTSIHCPYHDDRRPSAFIVESWTKGGVGIHCKTCGVTRWQGQPDEYDFEAFEKLVKRKLKNPTEGQDTTGFAQFFPPNPSVFEFNERYLPFVPYAPGITMIKSPKGTGKTEYLIRVLNHIREGKYHPDVGATDKIRSVVLIGHRRALLREAAKRLGLDFYLDEKPEIATRSLDDVSGAMNTPTPKRKKGGLRTLAVCLDSLAKWNEPYVSQVIGRKIIWARDEPHDLVIIDESEQVLRHLMGKTIAQASGGIERAYDALTYELARSKAVIALDADLGMLTAHALQYLRPQDWRAKTRIVVNQPIAPPRKRILQLYTRENALRSELMSSIARGERCFVATNSKKAANVLAKIIQSKFDNRISMRVITSDNSTNAEEIEFVECIKDEILSVQVLICSPSLGTGVDITFPDGACRVDHVFGCFYPKVNTHTDMDQQLARVRNPGSVKIWISPGTNRYTSNFDVIRSDLARAYYVPRAVKGRDEDGLIRFEATDPLLMICAHITAAERASKNQLINLFRQLREQQGWAVEVVESDEGDGKDRQEAEKAIWNHNTKALLAAQRLDDFDYFDLVIRHSTGAILSGREKIEFERNTLERALGGVVLTYDIIKLNYDGNLIRKVATLSGLFKHWEGVKNFPQYFENKNPLPLERMQKAEPAGILVDVAAAVCLVTRAGELRDVCVAASNLKPFAEFCERNRVVLEDILGRPLRKDLRRNPIKQLNAFFGLAGLKLEPAKRQKSSGKTTRSYAFDLTKFDLMMGFAVNFRPPTELESAAWQWKQDQKGLLAA